MRSRSKQAAALLTLAVCVGPVACRSANNAPPPQSEPQVIRCAVIGGMMAAGMWHALADRFEKATGHRIEVVAAGPKHVIAPAMREGQADLITMHASDTVINLVAEGFAVDPQPWARNDLVIVGPAPDPAGVRGLTDAADALARIVQGRHPLVIHQSLGAQEVLNDLLEAAQVTLDPDSTLMPVEDPGAFILEYAAEHEAYTLVGRIPFLDGKMPRAGLELMVQGDPRLRRPYIVCVANPKRWPECRYAAAVQLARFLRSAETQAWLAEYGRGVWDDQPFFFPVAPEAQLP